MPAMIAASLTLTSPCARHPVNLRTIQPTPERVEQWVARARRGFAARLGVSPLAVDWDVRLVRADNQGRV